ncbi:nucleotidyl transferase AbiEii/AbiGii toxin family protein [Streptomyces roseoverticillatus]|uniref:nucleotidyl transferase AbiEii/AbiGii toxin family protein n=1 Tax=Streptomyces roseoverticillatus TaxID=66429 RepID=UPI0033E36778
MTTTPWERFRYGPWDAEVVVPQLPPDEATRAERDLPPTLRPVPGEGVVQHPVYDPAANHHARGMRLSEPEFTDPGTGGAWYTARRRALDLTLAAVAGSPWADHLVLRGSVLLKAWFGDTAREPGDLDFLVVPDTWQLGDARTDTMLEEIARAAEERSRDGGSPVRIDAAGAVSDEIWTYDRVPGRRLVLPWTAVADGVPPGTVQLDFVFNETLPAPPVRTEVLPGVPMPAASPELSLVWKLLWLVTDMHPEAKDLYDAVLLAEHVRVPYPLLEQVLAEAGEPADLSYILYHATEADWDEFAKDHAALAEDGEGWLTRLIVALAPGFHPQEDGTYAQLAAAFDHTADILRGEREAGGMAAVEQWLAARSLHCIEALVAVRELLGREEHTLDEAAEVLASFRETRGDRPSHPYRNGWRGDAIRTATRLGAACA